MAASTLGGTVRSDVAFQQQNIVYTGTDAADGTQGTIANAAAPNTNLQISVAGGTSASDIFVGTGYSYIQNANDTAPVIATGTDSVTTALVYEGDVPGTTFYAGTGTEYAAFAGYGNVFTAPTVAGGTYEVSAGLVGGSFSGYLDTFDAIDLMAAPSVGSAAMGNTVAAGGGNASIAAGLGDNAIFLGTGTALVTTEGSDSILGSTGAATVDGAGADTVFTGTGAFTFTGEGGTGTVIASADTTSAAVNIYGGTGAVTVFGGGGSLAAFGGSAGNNLLVSGAGNSSLVGGGNNDTLVASGAGTTTLVAGTGAETLFGGGSTGAANYFLGSGADQVIAGAGTDYIQFGTGSSTVFGGTGSDVFGVLGSAGGGNDLVVGFNSASDYLELQGFGASITSASVLASETVSGGSTFLSVPGDSSQIELYGVTNLTAANFI